MTAQLQNLDTAAGVSAHATRTSFDGVLLTIRSRKSYRAGVEAYTDSTCTPLAIFCDFEQGSTMRLAGIPVESKFYLIGNPVIARGLFRYSGAAGLDAPVRVCVSQRDGEQTRIEMDLPVWLRDYESALNTLGSELKPR